MAVFSHGHVSVSHYSLIDAVIRPNKTECSTPGATLVASFTMSGGLWSTETMMVVSSVIMAALGFSLFLHGVLGRFSGSGQKTRNTAMRIFFRASFTLFLPFMSYMFSQAKNKGVTARAQLILLWMILVEILRKKVNAMVAPAGDSFARGVGRFSIFDAVDQTARMVWIGYLIYANVHGFSLRSVFIILWLFSITKLVKRVACIELAKRSPALGKNAHIIAGYMAQIVEAKQQLLQSGDQDVPLRRCNYVVMGEEAVRLVKTRDGYRLPAVLSSPREPKELVRLCTIWELADADRVFRYNLPRKRQLEDLCLAFALFKLLRRRFEGFPTAEVGTDEARKLVLQGLLRLDGDNAAGNANRAFRVVELELNFLEEYYQASIPVALPNPALFIANFSFSIVFLLTYTIVVLLVTGNGPIFRVLGSIFRGLAGLSIDMVVQYRCLGHQVSVLVGMIFSSSDLIVTMLLMITLLAIELHEFALYFLSDWAAVSLLCRYAKNTSWKYSNRCAVIASLRLKSWHRSDIWLHQMSLLKFDPHPGRTWWVRQKWVLLSQLLSLRLSGLRREAVTEDVKVNLVESLIRSLSDAGCRRRLPRGTASLEKNGLHDLQWACNDSLSSAEVILIWHLATCLLESRGPEKRPPLPPHGKTAVTLSRYCAHLVMYAAELLPEDPVWTKQVFGELRKELYSFYRSSGSPASRRQRPLRLTGPPEGTMVRGALLGQALEVEAAKAEEDVWKALAEFWAELLVSLAPSSNVDGHARALAHGGEFITYIWAMLTHAGHEKLPPCPNIEVAHV